MTDYGHCRPGEPCVNVAEIKTVLTKQDAEHGGDVKLLASKIEDLRDALSALPKSIADAIRFERESIEKEFRRGSDHFTRIYERIELGEKQAVEMKLEREKRYASIQERFDKMRYQMLTLWVLIAVIGLGETGKLVAWLVNLIGA